MSNRPQTSSGAVKAIIEAGGLRLPAYRDQLPPKGVLPCVTIDDDVATTQELHGDQLDGHHGESEVILVHLWQPLRNQNGRAGERFTLARDLTQLLKRTPPFVFGPDDAPVRVYGLRIDGRARIIEGEQPNEIVQTTITVTMRRDA
jgi:hypothetical protein